MKLFKISLIIIAFMAASCEKEAAFKQKKTFENQNWLKFDKLLFQIPVEAGKTYTFNSIIVNDSNYHKRKIEIGLYLQMPNGENRAANHSLRVKDNEYNNLGVSTSQGFELITPLREKMSINEGGIINAEIVLHSGHYDNYGMVSFELEVVED